MISNFPTVLTITQQQLDDGAREINFSKNHQEKGIPITKLTNK